MNHNYLVRSVILLAVILITSCSSFEEKKSEILSPEDIQEQVILGKKLENPYSVSNMQRAKQSLEERGIKIEDEIKPTHLYVRFLPKDTIDMNKLYFGNDIELYDYPMDYEVLSEGGTYYRDSDLSAGQPNSQYAAVSVGHPLPDVPYEVLEELFIPNDENVRSSSYQLEDEALLITNNISPEEIGVRRGKWYPTGTIKIKNTHHNDTLPIRGVRVRARNWFRTRTAYTNANGYFKTDYFRGKDVGFSLKWESKSEKFDVRSGTTGQAFTDGPNKSKTWNTVFTNPATRSHFWGLIFVGGQAYLNTRLGFGDTPFDRISVQAYYDGKYPDVSKKWLGHYEAVSQNIEYYAINYDDSRPNFAAAMLVIIHEFAHAHHGEKYKGKKTEWRDNIDGNLKESWAYGTAYYISCELFGLSDYDIKNSKNIPSALQKFALQWNDGNDYANPVVWDMIDNYNQSGINETITGFTFNDILSIISQEDLTKIYNADGSKNSLYKGLVEKKPHLQSAILNYMKAKNYL